jgi:hypothetical protein
MEDTTKRGEYVMLLFVGLLILIVLFFVGLATTTKKELNKQLEIVKNYETTYLTKHGGTRLNNDEMLCYNLLSFDGGKIWYAFEYGKNSEVLIMGTAENVYPGLLAHLDAWDKIRAYMDEHGAINQDSITPELQELMDKAKLKIK